MITTRFGSEVQLLSGQDGDGFCKVKRADGAVIDIRVIDLRTDNQEELQRMYQQEEE